MDGEERVAVAESSRLHTIRAHFENLEDLSVQELFGAMGVYVLWTADQWSRPSYIGEGNLFRRINDHHDEWLGRKGGGVAAILGYTTERRAKLDAETIEATLLRATSMLGMAPPKNSQGAKEGAIYQRGGGHQVIRVNITGAHPLHWGNKLSGRSEFNWRWSDLEGWQLDSRLPWRSRTR